MGLLYGFLIVLEVLVCALLIVVIFMQKTKGGMGGSAFGGGAGEAIFGSRMGNVLTKATVVLGVIFLANTLILTVLTTRRGLVGSSVMEGAARRPAAQPQQPAMPGPGTGAADWMDMEMQPAADVPLPLTIPVGTEEVDSEEVIEIPSTTGMDMPVPEMETMPAPEVADDVEIPAVVDENAADLGR